MVLAGGVGVLRLTRSDVSRRFAGREVPQPIAGVKGDRAAARESRRDASTGGVAPCEAPCCAEERSALDAGSGLWHDPLVPSRHRKPEDH